MLCPCGGVGEGHAASPHYGLVHGEMGFHCRICASYYGRHWGTGASAVALLRLWREAQNKTQWLPAEARW